MRAEFRHMANPFVALALSFGLGLAPWMPGTFGAAGAFLLYPFVMQLPFAWQCVLTLVLLALGCWACGGCRWGTNSVCGKSEPS